MISLWMLYSVLIGLLMGVIGVGLQRVAASRRWPTRFIWAGALAVSFAWPAAAVLRHYVAPPQADSAVLIPFPITITSEVPATDVSASPDLATRIDRTVVALWLLATAFFLARLARNVVALRRSRATWRSRDVGGVKIQLSTNIGPAVVGVREMDVVVPEWILALDQPLLDLVLRHEQEHRAARDPYLLFAAAIAVVLMPWNVALWWHARRLRFAVEIDCDARVLRADPRPERYGMLLLTIAQRRSFAPSAFAPMLSEPTTQLEERINAMRTTRIGRFSVFNGAAAACVALGVACALQSPDNISGPRPSAPKQISPSQNSVYFEFQVEKTVAPVPGNMTPRYPDMLRSANVEGEVLAQFVVDDQGRVEMGTLKMLKATHELFSTSVASVLPMMKFTPALVGGRAVKQLVQMPFQFNLHKNQATMDAPKGGVKIVSAVEPARAQRSEKTVRRLSEVNVTAGPEKPVESPPNAAKPAKPSPGYFEFQVTKPAAALPGNAPPRYPDMLRSANVEGEVVAQFVVGPDGRADVSTLKVLKSTHPMFSESVKAALPDLAFSPAMVNGTAVRQLMQMPFTFSLSKQP